MSFENFQMVVVCLTTVAVFIAFMREWAPPDIIAAIQETGDLTFGKTLSEPGREVRLVEAIIGPRSPMLHRTIRDLGLRRRYGVVAVALHRRGQNLLENFQ